MRASRRRAFGAIAGAAGAVLPMSARAAGKAMPIRLVVLDVGGTIVEERGDVPEALMEAFGKHGITVSAAEIDGWRGAAKREVVRHFAALRREKVPSGELDRLTDAIYGDFSARIIESYKTVKPIPGAEDAFRDMRKMGLKLATSTGFDRLITSSIMTRLGWEHYFAARITSDDVAQGRPAPYMLFHAMEAARVQGVRETIAVGDTPLDLQAGRNGGLRGVVGVLSGAGKREAMEAEPHTDLIGSVADLPGLLRSKYGVK